MHMFSLMHIALLGALGVIQDIGCSKLAVVCWLQDMKLISSYQTPCSHIVFPVHCNSTGTTYLDSIRYSDLERLKNENPNVKLIPHLSSWPINCPGDKDYDSSLQNFSKTWPNITLADGIAFSVGSIPNCVTETLKQLLELAAESHKRDSFISIAYVSGISEDTEQLQSQVDMAIWNNTLDWEAQQNTTYGTLAKIIVPVDLKGKLTNEVNAEECKMIHSNVQDITVQWDDATSTPYIRQTVKQIFFETEMSIILKMASVRQKGFGGASVALSLDNGAGTCCGRRFIKGDYPLISAMGKYNILERPSKDLNQDKGFRKLNYTLVYCLWVGEDTARIEVVSECSLIVPLLRYTGDGTTQWKAFTASAMTINPSIKALFPLPAEIFSERFITKPLLSIIRTARPAGLDIILDSSFEGRHGGKIASALQELKNHTSHDFLFIVTLTEYQYCIEELEGLKTLLKEADYLNIAHSYANQKAMISKPPHSSRFDGNKIVFSLDLAIQLGFPPERILLGTINHGIEVNESLETITRRNISFKEVCDLKARQNFTEGWNYHTSTPYLISNRSHIIYENSTSIQIKLDLISEKELAGLSIFNFNSEGCKELSSDGKTLSRQLKEFLSERKTASRL